MHIFISYSRKDSTFAIQLCKLLTTERLHYWMDTADIAPGSIWRKELKKAIRQGYALLVIMSDAAHESTWVAKEIQYARRRNIPIIPVWRSGKLWDELEKYNYVEMKADSYTALPEALRDLLHDLDNAYRNRGVRRAGFSIFNVLDNRFFRAATTIAMMLAVLVLAWSLFWPDDADNNSNNDEGTQISQVASATDKVDTPTPTITLTPSHTPNANEIVQTAAAATLTAIAMVNTIDARVIELQIQQAATNAYFETGTASAQQSFTPTHTAPATDDGGGGGEPVDTSTTPTLSATETATATPDWYATAATEISASLTLNAQTVTPTPTPTITRTSPRMTRTPTTTSTLLPSVTPPPPLPTTPAATWTPSSTITPLPTNVPPSWTPTSSITPSVTPSLSPTAPTMPPTEAMFAVGTPGIANNPSHMIIAVYAGPSYDSTIVAFLYHTQAISIMGEVPGWVFIGYGWVRFDRVFPIGDEAVIPIFQTQVSAMIPSPTTDEDFRVIESYWMTRTVESGLVRRGPTITPDDFGVPTLDPTSNRNLALTLTQSAANTQTATALPPTHTPSLTPTPSDTRTPTRTSTPSSSPTRTATASITPSDTARPPASNTPTRTLTRTPTRTFTPLPPSNTPLPTATHTPVPSNTPIPPTNTPRPPTPIPQPTATIPFAVNITSVNPQGYGSHPSGVGCYANITVSVTEDISGEIWVTNANWNQGPESYYQFFAAGTNPYTATLGGDNTARDHTIKIITPKGQTEVSGVRCN